jgi:hypothetical protein
MTKLPKNFGKIKEKELIWKKGEQRCCVLVSIEGKTYQVALDKAGQESIVFILPQLFKNHIVKIMPNELPITIPKNTL